MVQEERNKATILSRTGTLIEHRKISTRERDTHATRDWSSEQHSLSLDIRPLISTEPFLRLKQIKQLAFLSQIWPSATHTRYEHSLGCYQIALQVICALQQWYTFDTQTITVFLLASLLHDIGHYDFAHYIEEIGTPILSHEHVGRRIIERSEIAIVLEREYHVSPRRIVDLIDPLPSQALPPQDAVLSALLNGALDVDKLDYIPRDIQACHLPFEIDIACLIASLRVHSSPTGLSIALTKEGIEALGSFLEIRQILYLTVYWHPLNRICHAMLRRAVQDALISNTVNVEYLATQNNNTLLAQFAHHTHYPISTQALAQALENQQHYFTVLEIRQHEPLFRLLAALISNSWLCRSIEIQLASELTTILHVPIHSYEVLLDFPRSKQWHMNDLFPLLSPPIAIIPGTSWNNVLGSHKQDCKRNGEAQPPIRVLVSEHVHSNLPAPYDETFISCLKNILSST